MTTLPDQNRTAFLDKLRVILTLLVILHHTAIMYGAEGGWYLRKPADGLAAKLLLTLFCSVNQAFFMGMFFLIAGYFTTSSYEKKGAGAFLKDRSLRLGLPILGFGFVLGPFTIALAEAGPEQSLLDFWWNWGGAFHFNIGPLWFAYALLLFSLSYAALRGLLPQLCWQFDATSLNHKAIAWCLLIWATASFALRLWVPTGQEKALLQIGYFSSYVLLFFLGCGAAKQRLLEQISARLALPWLVISILALPSLFAIAIACGALRGVDFHVNGGWSFAALSYAVWEPLVAAGIILSLLWYARVSAKPWAGWTRLARLSFAAYIVHAPVVVAFGRGSQNWQAASLIKFAVIGSAGVAFSFAVAALILCIPGAKRWL